MKKTLTKNEYMQLEGLVYLYKGHYKKADELMKIIDEFLETEEDNGSQAWEWLMDERVNNAKDLMKKLGIKLTEARKKR